jgi:hypothetical protein
MDQDIDNFLGKNDQIISALADRFRTHEARPSVEKIEGYLRQFETAERARLALRLLHHIEFIDSGKIRAIFREYFFDQLTQEQRTRAAFAILGGPEDSSSLLAYHCSKALTEREKPNQLFMSVREIIKQQAKERVLVVFADDNIGSGNQSTSIFREWMGLSSNSYHGGPLELEEREWLKRAELSFFFLTGFDQGIDKLQREATKLGIKTSFGPHAGCRRQRDAFRQQVSSSTMKVTGNRPSQWQEKLDTSCFVTSLGTISVRRNGH